MRGVEIARHTGTRGWMYDTPEARRPTRSQKAETYLRLFLHGDRGAIAWGYHDAAMFTAWRIKKNDRGQWTLTGTASRVEPFYLRQTQPTLVFTAPKLHGPPWCWPVKEVSSDGTTVRAILGDVEF